MSAVALGAAACSSSQSSNDGSPRDLVSFDISYGELPPGCPPGVANEKGVGGACTMGGNECRGGLRCSCDPYLNILPPDGTPCFCTLVQFATCDVAPANYCGQGATCCGYLQAGSACIPNACLQSQGCPAF